MFYFLTLILALCLCYLLIIIVDKLTKTKPIQSLLNRDPKMSGLVIKNTAGLVIILFLFVAVSPIYFEYTNSFDSKIVLYSSDGKATIHGWPGVFCWESKDRFYNVMGTMRYSHAFQPISENPKLRKYRYSFSVAITNPIVFYNKYDKIIDSCTTQAVLNESKQQAMVWNIVEYYLYEFEEKFGKDVVQLYNPKSLVMQKQFKKLLETYINKIFSTDGVTITFHNFNLEMLQ